MRTPIVDGRSIDQFIPANLRGMFYKNAIPQYKYAIHDGYDPYGFSTDGLVLYLPLWALKDSSFKSVDAYKHTATVTTATWKPNGRDFTAATPDYIELTTEVSSILNFTSGAFSIIARVKTDDLTAANAIFFRGQREVDGYEFFIDTDGTWWLTTNQSGEVQLTYASVGNVVIDTWYTLGISRDGATATLYKDGADNTDTHGTHIDPTTSAQPARIGLRSHHASWGFDGIIQSILVYNRALSAGEHLHTHNCLEWRT